MRSVTLMVSGIVLALLAAGVAGAISPHSAVAPVGAAAPVAGGISYQGRLSSSGGIPLTGTYRMRFTLFDAAVAGTALWDSGPLNQAVDRGLFNVRLGVDPSAFDGQALWLRIAVDGQVLSPRQEILAAPYALGLRPGAVVAGEPAAWSDSVLDVEMTGIWPAARAGGFHAPSTGTAVYAAANGGTGLFGASENSYGVWGSSDDSWGGYFTSSGGYGIRVHSSGTVHFDHGAYITAASGFGVYAQSANNQGVRGEAGDVTGIAQPLGAVGVVGIGTNRGTYGASGAGSGLYGVSSTNYGVWGQSSTYRGVTGRTSRSDNNYGIYTPDNLFSLNVNLAGAVMQVMQNGGTEPLAPGDLVAFSGINRAVTAVDGPIVQVRRSSEASRTAVAGVVFSRFNLDAVDPSRESPDGSGSVGSALEVTPAGDAAPGDYLLVVVQGPAEVNTSALGGGTIQPGDLLSARGAGLAGPAATVTIDGIETALPGTVFAKALEPLDGTQAKIYVYVTLQ